ncbi:suppressor of fused domain protein [Micromonospora sp. NPDC049171]|uniref:suppressor of fused domain protein n=1 Tax=Micromonospora sp. NPDC049171 TaxID=3155770 RepID=UPI0033D83E1B
MAEVTEANRSLARTVGAVFGGRPRVTRFWDGSHESHVEILTSAGQPQEGVTSYATIGLSDTPLPGRVVPPLGVELVGVCYSDIAAYPKVLARAAFQVINSGWRCEPGAVFPGVVSAHLETALNHLLLAPPFLWEDELPSRVVGDKTVAWLLALPISEGEADYRRRHGADALEDLFERAQIDIFDIGRPSVA